MSQTLSEQLVQDSFHSYLKSSLAQAKIERLLDADILSSAEADLMITGPALCLYFAALRSTTEPPSVPLPRTSKNTPPVELSYENCPPAFVSFLHLWADTVPEIQSLSPEHQHDLARLICGLEPISHPIQSSVNGIAADLRGIAIEIGQRRSFQDRYAADLQAAIDAGNSPGSSSEKKVTFVPPPGYDALSGSKPGNDVGNSYSEWTPGHQKSQSQPSNYLSPSTNTTSYRFSSPANSTSSFSTRSPTILTADSPAIEFIRETLYASLADALERNPSLRLLLKGDRPRAYFASVAFAILEVATTSMTPDGSIIGVLGTPLTLDQCPQELRPFMLAMAEIGKEAREIQEEDDMSAINHVQNGEEIPLSGIDRIKEMLENGVGSEQRRMNGEHTHRSSFDGRLTAFINKINALSLGMTRLKAFRERQENVFKVLEGVGE